MHREQMRHRRGAGQESMQRERHAPGLDIGATLARQALPMRVSSRRGLLHAWLLARVRQNPVHQNAGDRIIPCRATRLMHNEMRRRRDEPCTERCTEPCMGAGASAKFRASTPCAWPRRQPPAAWRAIRRPNRQEAHAP